MLRGLITIVEYYSNRMYVFCWMLWRLPAYHNRISKEFPSRLVVLEHQPAQLNFVNNYKLHLKKKTVTDIPSKCLHSTPSMFTKIISLIFSKSSKKNYETHHKWQRWRSLKFVHYDDGVCSSCCCEFSLIFVVSCCEKSFNSDYIHFLFLFYFISDFYFICIRLEKQNVEITYQRSVVCTYNNWTKGK